MKAKNSEPAAIVIWPTGTQKSNKTLHVVPGATVWVPGHQTQGFSSNGTTADRGAKKSELAAH